jgi:hypothetical protein
MRKEKDPEPDPYLWLIDPDPDPGDPKTCGSPTMVEKWYTLHLRVQRLCFLENDRGSLVYRGKKLF